MQRTVTSIRPSRYPRLSLQLTPSLPDMLIRLIVAKSESKYAVADLMKGQVGGDCNGYCSLLCGYYSEMLSNREVFLGSRFSDMSNDWNQQGRSLVWDVQRASKYAHCIVDFLELAGLWMIANLLSLSCRKSKLGLLLLWFTVSRVFPATQLNSKPILVSMQLIALVWYLCVSGHSYMMLC
ncbi:hypothetical protein Ancab_027817 [Ancistrocladus abbreviatus]